MKDKIINWILQRCKTDCLENLEKVKYQIECLYTFLTKLLSFIIISFILNIFEYVSLLILFMLPLRAFCFGFHAKNNFQCWIVSFFMYTMAPLFIKHYLLTNPIIITFSIISILNIIVFSPASSNKKPLLNYKKNLVRKVVASLISIFYFLIIISTNLIILKKCLLLVLIYQAFLVSPITYKISARRIKKQSPKLISGLWERRNHDRKNYKCHKWFTLVVNISFYWWTWLPIISTAKIITTKVVIFLMLQLF